VRASTWIETVDGHVEDTLGPDEVENLVDVAKYSHHLILFRESDDVISVSMGAVVDNAIHVQIEVVKLWHSNRRSYRMQRERITLRQPSEKSWDSHHSNKLINIRYHLHRSQRTKSFDCACKRASRCEAPSHPHED
jgi:hypothetical protein